MQGGGTKRDTSEGFRKQIEELLIGRVEEWEVDSCLADELSNDIGYIVADLERSKGEDSKRLSSALCFLAVTANRELRDRFYAEWHNSCAKWISQTLDAYDRHSERKRLREAEK